MPDAGRQGFPWWIRWNLLIVATMALVVLAACSVALWLVDSEGRHLIMALDHDRLVDKLDLLSELQREEGREGLIRSVNLRARLEDEHQVYALKDDAGRILAGNVQAWPAGVGEAENWRVMQDTQGRGTLHVSTRRLLNGLVVLVGTDSDDIETFQDDVNDALWIAIAIVAAACLSSAAVITSFLTARVRALAGTAQRVSEGDFSARASGAGRGGPFGTIAAAQNAMLDRIEHLIVGLRTVTDSLAHDLRTPLAQVRRHIEEAIASTGANEKEQALEAALAAADQTIGAFTSLIDIARAEEGFLVRRCRRSTSPSWSPTFTTCLSRWQRSAACASHSRSMQRALPGTGRCSCRRYQISCITRSVRARGRAS